MLPGVTRSGFLPRWKRFKDTIKTNLNKILYILKCLGADGTWQKETGAAVHELELCRAAKIHRPQPKETEKSSISSQSYSYHPLPKHWDCSLPPQSPEDPFLIDSWSNFNWLQMIRVMMMKCPISNTSKSILRPDLKTEQFAPLCVFTACIMGMFVTLTSNNKVGINKRKPGKTKTPCWFSQKPDICAGM